MRTTIGFIGTGVMGASMAQHLLKAGNKLVVYNRTKAKAQPLLDLGATWANTPSEVASQATTIFTIVGFPHDVEEVYLGKEGILTTAKPKTICCDFTTSSPALAEKLANEGLSKDCAILDAPVSGGDIGAKNATLSIMVGGNKTAFELLKPLLALMGKNIVYQGKAGSGQHTKMCNQIKIAGTMMGAIEAVIYAKASGLDPHQVLQSIQAGAAGSWTLDNLVPRILEENYNPGFYVAHYIKDMDIALAEAKRLGITLPALHLARNLYERLVHMGHEKLGTQALYLAYEAMR